MPSVSPICSWSPLCRISNHSFRTNRALYNGIPTPRSEEKFHTRIFEQAIDFSSAQSRQYAGRSGLNPNVTDVIWGFCFEEFFMGFWQHSFSLLRFSWGVLSWWFQAALMQSRVDPLFITCAWCCSINAHDRSRCDTVACLDSLSFFVHGSYLKTECS